jgi:multidrug resistance efflux pump
MLAICHARRGEAAAALELSQANLRYAEADLRRKRRLRAARLLAPSDLDLAEKASAVAEQQRAQAQASPTEAEPGASRDRREPMRIGGC